MYSVFYGNTSSTSELTNEYFGKGEGLGYIFSLGATHDNWIFNSS